MAREVIVDYHGYLVSSMGFIYGKYVNKLKTRIGPNGYEIVDLFYDGRDHTEQVHRIIAICHCNKPRHCKVVHHKDANKLNNRADNLEWVTYKKNNMEHIKESNKGHKVICNGTEYYSIGEAARCEGVRKCYIYYWLKHGGLDKSGRMWKDGNEEV